MSCLSLTLRRVGSIEAEASLVPSGVSAELERSGAPEAALRRVGGLAATAQRVRVTARLTRVCDTDIRTPYLEIEPTILWVYPDIANTNDVFSNTYWRVN